LVLMLGKKGDPDFRNKAFHFTPCKEGDILFMVSDGVYDNFDPEHLGYAPYELRKKGFKSDDEDFLRKLEEFTDWTELPNELCTRAKEDFLVQRLQEELHAMGDDLCPSRITETLLKIAWKTTEPSRKYMELNPNLPEPTNYVEYPGKMDHTTCVCLRIQNLEVSGGASSGGTGAASDTTESVEEPHTPNPATPDTPSKKPVARNTTTAPPVEGEKPKALFGTKRTKNDGEQKDKNKKGKGKSIGRIFKQ